MQTPFSEGNGSFSPDGHWIAYSSIESGKSEVYVQTFPSSVRRLLVSTNGGRRPQWREDGKELFYVSYDGKLMAVDVRTDGTFEAGIPKALFDLSAWRTRAINGYGVMADGQRFIFVTQQEETVPPSLNVVVNWTAGLKK